MFKEVTLLDDTLSNKSSKDACTISLEETFLIYSSHSESEVNDEDNDVSNDISNLLDDSQENNQENESNQENENLVDDENLINLSHEYSREIAEVRNLFLI